MQNFNKTLTLLDQLINRLEANTGGQVIKGAKVAQTKKKEEVVPKKQQTQLKEEKIKEKVEQKVEKVEEKKEQKKEQNEEKEKKGKKEKKQKEKKEGQVKVKEEKKEKKQQPKKEPGQIGVQDFALVDMRIGEIVDVWKHPESQKLYCEKINVCGEIRQIASGLQQFVPIEDMKGPVVVMVNLKPRPLAGFPSNGMVVCASNSEHTAIEVLRPEGNNSQRIFLEGHEDIFKGGPVLPVLNPKKKILEKCLQHFKTDEEGFVTWKGIRARTSVGYLRANIMKGNVS